MMMTTTTGEDRYADISENELLDEINNEQTAADFPLKHKSCFSVSPLG